MGYQNSKQFVLSAIGIGLAFILLGGAFGYGFWYFSERLDVLSSDLASTTALLAENTTWLSNDITALRSDTVGLSDTLSSTRQNLDAVKSQVGGVEDRVGSISGTVGTLEKLSQLDPELLRKYSKVYFLNENYTPPHLVSVVSQYLYDEDEPERFLEEAWPFLEKLLAQAEADGEELFVRSAYRSFGEQSGLKSYYKVVYGEDTANTFAADQGYSEHQLGTTVDFITTGIEGTVDGFETTSEYLWLLGNAHRFGFTLSYPKDNTHYVFEPWHWRFVGVGLATYLRENDLNLYDVDQRELDSYLISIFD